MFLVEISYSTAAIIELTARTRSASKLLSNARRIRRCHFPCGAELDDKLLTRGPEACALPHARSLLLNRGLSLTRSHVRQPARSVRLGRFPDPPHCGLDGALRVRRSHAEGAPQSRSGQPSQTQRAVNHCA